MDAHPLNLSCVPDNTWYYVQIKSGVAVYIYKYFIIPYLVCSSRNRYVRSLNYPRSVAIFLSSIIPLEERKSPKFRNIDTNYICTSR